MAGVLLFELFVLVLAIFLFSFMVKKGYQNVTRKFLILFIGILLFEIISEPMWLNTGFDSWAYMFRDITWVLTLGWVTVFMMAIIGVDYFFRGASEKKKFFLYLLF